MDYGHWTTSIKFDVNEILAFVYVATCIETGQKYIGVKKCWVSIKKPPCEYSRRTSFKESNWKKYTTSSKVVNRMIEEGKTFHFHILETFTVWGEALYEESVLLIENGVLTSDKWLNQSIGGSTFGPDCVPIKYFDPDDVAKIIELFKTCKSSEIAEFMGCSQSRILRILRKSGIDTSRTSKNVTSKIKKADTSLDTTICDAYIAGKTLVQIGESIGRQHSYVKLVLVRNNIKLRTSHGYELTPEKLHNIKKAHSSGTWITPYGEFFSIKDASKQLDLDATCISDRCKNNDKIIGKNTTKCAEKEHIGQTWKAVGWSFVKRED